AEYCGNVELCRLTEQVMFSDPYKVSQYNRWTSPYLNRDAEAVREDNLLKLEVAELKSKRTRSGFLRQLKIPGIFSITNSLLFGMSTDMVRFSPYNVLKEGIYTYWAPEEYQSRWILYIDLQELVSFNVLQLQEPIQMGQRVSEFRLEALQQDGVWKRVTNGTTIGYQRLLLFPKVKSQHLMLVIDKSRANPLISYLGIYMDPVTIWSSIYDDTILTSHFNAIQIGTLKGLIEIFIVIEDGSSNDGNLLPPSFGIWIIQALNDVE
ncbi:hypothetical protein S245_059210, partial [Arachis hypogaea]